MTSVNVRARSKCGFKALDEALLGRRDEVENKEKRRDNKKQGPSRSHIPFTANGVVISGYISRR